MAANFGRFRFRSADQMIEFVDEARRELLRVANFISRRPSENQVPSVANRLLGRITVTRETRIVNFR